MMLGQAPQRQERLGGEASGIERTGIVTRGGFGEAWMFVVGGESLIDLISKPIGADGKRELVAKAGGSPMNCAIALSKLGNASGFLGPISSDSFGDFILEPLHAAKVNVLLKDRVREPSTLAVVTDDGKGNPRYAFYREADRAFTREGLIAALPADIEVFQI